MSEDWTTWRHRESRDTVGARPVDPLHWEVRATPDAEPELVDRDAFEAEYEFPELSTLDVIAAEDTERSEDVGE